MESYFYMDIKSSNRKSYQGTFTYIGKKNCTEESNICLKGFFTCFSVQESLICMEVTDFLQMGLLKT